MTTTETILRDLLAGDSEPAASPNGRRFRDRLARDLYWRHMNEIRRQLRTDSPLRPWGDRDKNTKDEYRRLADLVLAAVGSAFRPGDLAAFTVVDRTTQPMNEEA